MSVLRRTLVLSGVLVLAAAGCGSNSLEGGSTSAPTSAPSSAPSSGRPQKMKSAGKIVVGFDASYPPNEFLQGGKTVVGMDVDLFNAVAQKFGVTVDWLASLPARSRRLDTAGESRRTPDTAPGGHTRHTTDQD